MPRRTPSYRHTIDRRSFRTARARKVGQPYKLGRWTSPGTPRRTKGKNSPYVRGLRGVKAGSANMRDFRYSPYKPHITRGTLRRLGLGGLADTDDVLAWNDWLPKWLEKAGYTDYEIQDIMARFASLGYFPKGINNKWEGLKQMLLELEMAPAARTGMAMSGVERTHAAWAVNLSNLPGELGNAIRQMLRVSDLPWTEAQLDAAPYEIGLIVEAASEFLSTEQVSKWRELESLEYRTAMRLAAERTAGRRLDIRGKNVNPLAWTPLKIIPDVVGARDMYALLARAQQDMTDTVQAVAKMSYEVCRSVGVKLKAAFLSEGRSVKVIREGFTGREVGHETSHATYTIQAAGIGVQKGNTNVVVEGILKDLDIFMTDVDAKISGILSREFDPKAAGSLVANEVAGVDLNIDLGSYDINPENVLASLSASPGDYNA